MVALFYFFIFIAFYNTAGLVNHLNRSFELWYCANCTGFKIQSLSWTVNSSIFHFCHFALAESYLKQEQSWAFHEVYIYSLTTIWPFSHFEKDYHHHLSWPRPCTVLSIIISCIMVEHRAPTYPAYSSRWAASCETTLHPSVNDLRSFWKLNQAHPTHTRVLWDSGTQIYSKQEVFKLSVVL